MCVCQKKTENFLFLSIFSIFSPFPSHFLPSTLDHRSLCRCPSSCLRWDMFRPHKLLVIEAYSRSLAMKVVTQEDGIEGIKNDAGMMRWGRAERGHNEVMTQISYATDVTSVLSFVTIFSMFLNAFHYSSFLYYLIPNFFFFFTIWKICTIKSNPN